MEIKSSFAESVIPFFGLPISVEEYGKAVRPLQVQWISQKSSIILEAEFGVAVL